MMSQETHDVLTPTTSDEQHDRSVEQSTPPAGYVLVSTFNQAEPYGRSGAYTHRQKETRHPAERARVIEEEE